MKRAHRRPISDYLIGVVLVIVFVYVSFLVVDIYHKQEVARKAAADAKQEVKELEERQRTLEANLRDLETPRGQETSYREQFGVALPGEEVIIVVSPETETPQTGLTWWRKLMGWFGL